MNDVDDKGLDGRVAWVTGAARGIGAEIAERLAEAGAVVAASDLRAPALDHPGVRGYACDVRRQGDVDGTLRAIDADLGAVDALINNAGVLRVGPFAETADDDWEALIDVNLTGAFRCTRAVLPAMLGRRFGRIISLTSITAIRGEPFTGAYAASKGGLIGMTKSLAREVASRGVTVNAVAPGYVETEQTREAFEGSAGEAVSKQIPARRLATPEDIAPMMVFLVGDGASYVTGQVLAVDGGVT